MFNKKNFYQIRSNEYILNRLEEERKSTGYCSLPFEDTTYIKDLAKKESINKDTIVVIGIGGSSLGANAIYDFLKRKYQFKKELIFFETTDPIDINSKFESLNLVDTLFIAISKSGTTVETIAILKYISTKVDFNRDNLVVISQKDTQIKELDFLEGVSFSKLIQMQADATIEAIDKEKDIPYDVITIDKVDEYNIAELIYSYELLVSIIGVFLQINTYDQPGVESGKIILKKRLKKGDLE